MFTQNKLKMDPIAEEIRKIMEADAKKVAEGPKEKLHSDSMSMMAPVLKEESVDEARANAAPVRVQTKKGEIVYGGARGGSAKAYRDQHFGKDDDETWGGPSKKDIKHSDEPTSSDMDDVDDMIKKSSKKGAIKEEELQEMDGQSRGRDWDTKAQKKGKEFTAKITTPSKVNKTALDILNKQPKKIQKEDISFAARLIKSIKEDKISGAQETFTDNNMGEDSMSASQMKKREKYVIGMKDKTAEFKAKYGKRWKDVMYATATKMAMKENQELDEWKVEGEWKKSDPEDTRSGSERAKALSTLGAKKAKSPIKDKDFKEEVVAEAEVVTRPGDSEQVTTDMLTGREKGGQANSFKSYKLQLKIDGEMKAPEMEKRQDTREKQKVTTNPGPVNIRPDSKLTDPSPYTHFSNEKHITSEGVRGMLKRIRKVEKKERSKELDDFSKKVVQAEEVEYYEINEEKPEHTHVAHFEDKDGNWAAKLLINADHDGHAIDQAKDAAGKGPFGALKVRKVERVTKVMEGTTPPFDMPYTKAKGDASGNIKDKSGAVHTPMSRAKDLARTSMAKMKKESLLGTAGATSESVDEEVEKLEENILDDYLSSMGMNPDNVPKAKKIGYANSEPFLKWKQSRQ